MTRMHTSVLAPEALELLHVHSNKNYVDCTLGAGGHTAAILDACGPRGIVIACDLDPSAIKDAKKRLVSYGDRFRPVRVNFRNLDAALKKAKVENVAGILFDLGLSMDLIKASDRGFSFNGSEPLDMRLDSKQELTAAEVVNTYSEKALADCIFHYGEERYSRSIARKIIAAREKKPFKTTDELVAVIESAVPGAYRRRRTHCATKTFQALRIEVNDELGALLEGLQKAMQALEGGGYIAVISFHSLEDRIVKHFFRDMAKQGKGKILTKRPLVATEEEILANPASRSAKLRAFQGTVS